MPEAFCNMNSFVYAALSSQPVSGTDSEALAPETAAACGGGGAYAVCLVFFQKLTAAAEETGGVAEGVHTFTEISVSRAFPDILKALIIYIAEGFMDDPATVVVKEGVGSVQQAHARGNISVPANETVPFLNKAAIVHAPCNGFALP